jgi:hypothetical protein
VGRTCWQTSAWFAMDGKLLVVWVVGGSVLVSKNHHDVTVRLDDGIGTLIQVAVTYTSIRIEKIAEETQGRGITAESEARAR